MTVSKAETVLTGFWYFIVVALSSTHSHTMAMGDATTGKIIQPLNY